MLAAAWRIVGLTLTQEIDSEQDSQIRNLLSKDAQFRAQYLVLYDLVNVIVGLGQQKFAQLATTARKCCRICSTWPRLLCGLRSALESVFSGEPEPWPRF